MECARGVRATRGRGLGVGVTQPSLISGLVSTENWDKDGEHSSAGLLWNNKKEVWLLATEV